MNNKKTTILFFIIMLIYFSFSSILLVSDMKEPDRLVFDIAFPKADENEPDISTSVIENQISYSPIIDANNRHMQIFYTPKITTGIQIWLKISDTNTSGNYVMNFHDSQGNLQYSQEFSSRDISPEGYTTIMFDDFMLEEGQQYKLIILPQNEDISNLTLGLIPNTSTWTRGLYDAAGLIEGTSICFNLIYDYQNWGFINWMVLTLICVFILMYFISKGVKQQIITRPKLIISTLVIIMLILITGFVIGYSKLII